MKAAPTQRGVITVMSRDEILGRASPLARRFRNLFVERLGHLPYAEEYTNRYELSVPAPHPDLGELRVRDDGDELTISVGPHHWHVALDRFDHASPGRQVDLAAEAAVGDVQRLVEGRTVLRVQRRDGRVGATMGYDIGHPHIGPPGEDEVEYLWTGPR